MEPRILAGHKYLCKKSVIGSDKKTYYTARKVYKCEISSYYNPKTPDFKYSCGHITNDSGNKWHAWPYDPQNNPLCHDSWTDYFTDITK